MQAGVPLIATNPDSSFPSHDGERWPGTGALVAVVETTTGVRAEVVGKPSPSLFEFALARAGGGDPLVVGDRLDTDIAGAVALGWASFLVLTGISSRADIARMPFAPSYVWDDLSLLVDPDS